jgi:hypothetical protein
VVEDIVRRLSGHPDVVRVMVSDREGLLVVAQQGPSAAGSAADAEMGDDLWNAFMAQFAANVTTHLKNVTLSRPMEMVVHGTTDDILVVWLGIGWLIARTTSTADWPSLISIVQDVRREFEALTG